MIPDPVIVKVIQHASPLPSRNGSSAVTNKQTEKLTNGEKRTSVLTDTRTDKQTNGQNRTLINKTEVSEQTTVDEADKTKSERNAIVITQLTSDLLII